MLKGRKILIGITGSIAAYKIPLLIRLLKKEGAEVQVIMTSFAREFVTPLTLSTLSENPVLIESHDSETGKWNSHIELGLWADVFLIAPLSANTMAKMARGIADNLLLTTYLSARNTVMFAPAMDLDMYKHPATTANIKTLKESGNILIEATEGELASGLCGEGRMEEPEKILARIKDHFKKKARLKNKKVLVTAGPTQEPIDPVRFIGNHSSGKMGFAIAEEAANNGATVYLISGSVAMQTDHPGIYRIDVSTAEEMYHACLNLYKDIDIAVLSAAVADYRPKQVSAEKIKKGSAHFEQIELLETKDILKELGKRKTTDQILVGFALETDNEEENAGKKIQNKNLDFIVLNSLKDKDAGFGSSTNKITIIDKNRQKKYYALKTKKEVAADIMDKIYELTQTKE